MRICGPSLYNTTLDGYAAHKVSAYLKSMLLWIVLVVVRLAFLEKARNSAVQMGRMEDSKQKDETLSAKVEH